MDTLKFRAYVPAKHCYMEVYSIEFDSYKAILRGRWNKAKSFLTMKAVPIDRIILEQCTGLLDRNGKKIYEGDIVRVSYGYNYEVRQFRTGAWRIGRDDLYVWADSSEVIGNIHESPELLGDEE